MESSLTHNHFVLFSNQILVGIVRFGMKFRRQGKQLDTETATMLYKCRTFSIMKNNNNTLFFVQKIRGKSPDKNRSYIVRIISEDEARGLVREKDSNADFRVFENQSYDIRVQLNERQNALLFEMAYEQNTDKKKMLMEIIEQTLQSYEKQKSSRKNRRSKSIGQ